MAIVGAAAALVAGGLASVSQTQQAREASAQAAATYKPAVEYTAPPEPIKAAFLGDSFTVGSGADNKEARWTTEVARANGWIELNYGQGGTNYSSAGSIKNAKSYVKRLTDLTASRPDIVVVSSAGNDLSTNQTPGIKETFQTLREELPDAEIVATSPYYRADEMPPAYESFGDAIEREVEEIGGQYLDIKHPLAGHPEGMSKDDIHPNDVGYQLIAEAFMSAWKTSDR